MPKKGELKPIRHGTPGGYYTHRRRNESACDECRKAHNLDAFNKKRKKNGLEPILPEPEAPEGREESVIVPVDVLIIGDVIDIQVTPGVKTARCVIEMMQERPDGGIDFALALESNRTRKAYPTLPRLAVEQGFRLVPVLERLAA